MTCKLSSQGTTRISLSCHLNTKRIVRSLFKKSHFKKGPEPGHTPRSNRHCFQNSAFQAGMFRGWSRSGRAEGTKMLENTDVFRHLFPPKVFPSVARRGEGSEKHL